MKTKKTTDVYFASAILALGGKLEDTDKSDPRHMVFELSLNLPKFQSTVLQSAVENGSLTYSAPVMDLDYYENQWANGTLMINAISFKDAIQRMKSVIHSK